MAGLYIMDMATIMVGNDQPESLNHLKLTGVQLPSLEEMTSGHTPGGSVMALDIGMTMLNALNLTFKMKGLNPESSRKLGIGQARRIDYTIRGNVRDVREDRNFAAKAVVNGRMTMVNPSEFARESGIDEDFAIKEIVRYSLFLDGSEKFYFDFFRGPAGARVDGNPIFGAQAGNLGLI
ncbi:MAG: phage major tail tube protein [Beijerinckiaceae bacterium]